MARAKPHEIKAYGYGSQSSYVPYITSKATDKLPYLSFYGNDNDFPKRIVETYERSSIHKAAILTKFAYTVGQGLQVNNLDGSPYQNGTNANMDRLIGEANIYGDTLQDVFNQSCLDQILFGGHVVDVTGEGTPETLAIIKSQFGHFRYKKDENLRELYKASAQEWEEVKSKTKIEFETFPVYKDGTGVLYSVDISPDRIYYPLPDYYTLAFKAWSDIEYKIPDHNNSRLDNQLIPSGLLTFYGQPPAGISVSEFLDEMIRNFTGRGNSGKVLAQVVSDASQKPTFEPVTEQPDGMYTELDRLTADNILQAHRMHPSLLSKTAGSLGEAGQFRVIFEVFLNSVIVHYQNSVLDSYNKVLKDNDLPYKLSITNVVPVSFSGDIDVKQVLSIDEQRELLGYGQGTIYKQEQVNALLDLSAKVTANLITREKAIKLAGLYGFDEQTASEYL